MTVQAQILEELRRLRAPGVSIMLITHDLGVIAQMADHVAVMYAGRIAEEGDAESIFRRPRHPYTWALLAVAAAARRATLGRLRQVQRPPAGHDEAAGAVRLRAALPQGAQRVPPAGLTAAGADRAGPLRRLLQPDVPGRRGRRQPVDDDDEIAD